LANLHVLFSHKSSRKGSVLRDTDQLGALGLVVNILALWNTIYMEAVLEQLRIEGYALKPEDVARLSPLTFDHINFLGRYAFALPDSVAHGQLRPLRSPDAPEDE
jgi:hypothetical protein